MDHQKLLIVGFVWPEPNSSAAGSRMMQLLSLFLKQKWQVTFASAAADSDHMANLEMPGVVKKSIQLNSPCFDNFIIDLNPSIVLFDRFMTEEQYGWRVAKHLPNALRILDTEDLHSLRLARQKAVKEDRAFEMQDLLAEETAKREIAAILRCDVSLIVSKLEMQILSQVFKIDHVLLYYLPLFAETIDLLDLPQFEQRQDFVFIGNFLHEPNKDAVKYLKDAIWPLINEHLPEAKMHVYGAYPTQQVLQWHKPASQFYVHGRAENASSVVRHAKVVLAPLRFGAGIKGKLLESMAFGTPSVTTSIGSEAMHGPLPWNGTIADDPQEFAHAAVALYHNKTKWLEAQQHGVEIINQRFLEVHFKVLFWSHIDKIMSKLAEHRQQNFTGAMLQHHTMKSTEYMSRWIEAKNDK